MGLVEDIIAVKGALDQEWDDIVSTSQLINTLFSQAITQLDTYEEQVANGIESVWSEMIGMLESIDGSDLELILKQVTLPPGLKTALNTLESDLSSAADELDAITGFLGGCPHLPNLSTVPPLSELNATTFKSILEDLKEADFSLAVKKLKPAQPTSIPGEKTAEQKGQDLAEMLFSSFEQSLGTYFDNNAAKLEKLITELETAIGDDLWSALQASVTNAIESFFVQGEAKAEVTVDDLLGQITTLIKDDTALLKKKMAGLTKNLTITKSEVIKILKGVLNVQAIDGDLSTFCKEVLQLNSNPTLQEAVSFLIAIPLTLGAQATTGKNFSNAGVLSAIDDNQKNEMRAILMMMGVTMELLEKAYEYRLDKKKQPVSWQYKAITGAIGTIKSSLIQYSWYPDHGGFFSGPNASNSIWFVGWFTGVGFSTLQWMLDVHWSRKNDQGLAIDNLFKDVSAYGSNYDTDFQEFKTAYSAFVATMQSKNISIEERDLTTLSENITSIQTVAEAFMDLPLPSTSEKVSGVIDQLESLELKPNTDALLSSIARQLNILARGKIVTVDPAKTQFENTEELLNALELQNGALSLLKQRAKIIKDGIAQGQVSEVSHSMFLDFYCPLINIWTTYGIWMWKLVLTLKEEEEWETFDKATFTSALSMISSIADIYAYEKEKKEQQDGHQQDNKEEKKEEEDKGLALSIVKNTIFGLSNFYELWEVKELLTEEVTLKGVQAATGSKTVNVTFSGAVTKHKSSVAECFTIATKAKPGSPLSIATGAPGDEDGTFTLTMSDVLPGSELSLEVTSGAFTSMFGAVDGTMDFYPKVYITKAGLNRPESMIGVVFNTVVNAKATLSAGSFTLSNGPKGNDLAITSVHKFSEPNSYVIKLSGTLPTSGFIRINTAAGAFQTQNGDDVAAFALVDLKLISL